eukprot:1650003-Lingulodinium_polyedra.AAC.1
MSVWTRIEQGRYADRTTSMRKETVCKPTEVSTSSRGKSKCDQSMRSWISTTPSINQSIKQ